ncbi:glycosyltransferase family 4 protein [Mucilaginibacter calamicampi]|uniref:Glycosyltransferase family 4 protein n=1 Tax=Mucilaginibacter calamicampi TaxID=1302352 RepID=A0ABW2YZZ0_9SPHI
MLKILWFSLSPGLSATHVNNNYMGLGWLKALESNIQDKVDLSIAFYHHDDHEPFTLGNTRYFPVKRYKKGKVSEMLERITNSLESDRHIATFLKIIDEVKPDVIHVHGTETNYGLIQKYTDIPVVLSIQSIITVYHHKYFSTINHFHVRKYSRVKEFILFRSFNNVYRRFNKMAQRELDIYRHTKHVIGRTAWDKRVASILAPNAIYHHNDEVLRSGFYQKQWAASLNSKITLFTTNGPDIYKGIETLLHCALLLDMINISFEWRVAGLNVNDETVAIAAKVVGKPISKNIKFLGTVAEDDLITQMLQASIYVSTSHIENSPNSLCEAQILGMPCVTTNAGGTSTLIQDGKEGIVIQDGDPFVMAGAIVEMINDYKKAADYGRNSRKTALERHDPQKITNELLDIYNAVAQRN